MRRMHCQQRNKYYTNHHHTETNKRDAVRCAIKRYAERKERAPPASHRVCVLFTFHSIVSTLVVLSHFDVLQKGDLCTLHLKSLLHALVLSE